jgi:hypothetical protein
MDATGLRITMHLPVTDAVTGKPATIRYERSAECPKQPDQLPAIV